MKRLFILFALVLVVSVSVHGTPASAYKQKQGYVPDADAAVLIATAILIPIYGQQQVMFNLPMSAALKDGIWRVTGKLPPGMAGGVAEVKISQATGKILGVIHGDMPMAPNKLDQVAFPGASLKWIHIAEPEFKRLNINLDDYTIHVWDKASQLQYGSSLPMLQRTACVWEAVAHTLGTK